MPLKASVAELAQAKTKKDKDRVKLEAVESARAALARIGTPDEVRPDGPEPVRADAGAEGAGARAGAESDPVAGRGGDPDHADAESPGGVTSTHVGAARSTAAEHVCSTGVVNAPDLPGGD